MRGARQHPTRRAPVAIVILSWGRGTGGALKIESVDFFYLAMPVVTTEADGSQDALLVRVSAGGHVGWGECEAAPLPSIAAFVCPMSHGVCRPVGASILGQTLDGPADIAPHVRPGRLRQHGPAAGRPHPIGRRDGACGICWDARVRSPCGNSWATRRATPRFPTPRACLATRRNRRWRRPSFRARRASRRRSSAGDRLGAAAPRRTPSILPPRARVSGADGILLVDVGQIFIEDVARAAERLPALGSRRRAVAGGALRGGGL